MASSKDSAPEDDVQAKYDQSFGDVFGEIDKKQTPGKYDPSSEKDAQSHYDESFGSVFSNIGKPKERKNQVGQLEDIGRGSVAGLERGTAALAGLPGTALAAGRWGAEEAGYYGRKAGEALGVADEGSAKKYWKDVEQQRKAPDRDWIMGAIPTSEATTKLAEKYIPGADYHAKTFLGRTAQTMGEFAPSALIPGGGLSLAGRLGMAGVAGAASEAAGELTKGTGAEPYARIVGALAAPYAAERAIPAMTLAAAEKTGLASKLGAKAMNEEQEAARAAGKSLPYTKEELLDVDNHARVGRNLVNDYIDKQGFISPATKARNELIDNIKEQMRQGKQGLTPQMIDEVVDAMKDGRISSDQALMMTDAFNGTPKQVFQRFFNQATLSRPDIRDRLAKITEQYMERQQEMGVMSTNLFKDLVGDYSSATMDNFLRNKSKFISPEDMNEFKNAVDQGDITQISDILKKVHKSEVEKAYDDVINNMPGIDSSPFRRFFSDETAQKYVERTAREINTERASMNLDPLNIVERNPDTGAWTLSTPSRTPAVFWSKLAKNIKEDGSREAGKLSQTIHNTLGNEIENLGFTNFAKKANDVFADTKTSQNAFDRARQFVSDIGLKKDPVKRQQALQFFDGLSPDDKSIYAMGVYHHLYELARQEGGWKTINKIMSGDNLDLMKKVMNYGMPQGADNFKRFMYSSDLANMMSKRFRMDTLQQAVEDPERVGFIRRWVTNPASHTGVASGLLGTAAEAAAQYSFLGASTGLAGTATAMGYYLRQVAKDNKARAMLDILESHDPQQIKALLMEAAASKVEPSWYKKIRTLFDLADKDVQKQYLKMTGNAAQTLGRYQAGQIGAHDVRAVRGYKTGGRIAFKDGGKIDKKALKKAEKLGRNGDTILAHINKAEAAYLKRLGGSGKINPKTGLREFSVDGEGPEAGATGSASSSDYNTSDNGGGDSFGYSSGTEARGGDTPGFGTGGNGSVGGGGGYGSNDSGLGGPGTGGNGGGFGNTGNANLDRMYNFTNNFGGSEIVSPLTGQPGGTLTGSFKNDMGQLGIDTTQPTGLVSPTGQIVNPAESGIAAPATSMAAMAAAKAAAEEGMRSTPAKDSSRLTPEGDTVQQPAYDLTPKAPPNMQPGSYSLVTGITGPKDIIQGNTEGVEIPTNSAFMSAGINEFPLSDTPQGGVVPSFSDQTPAPDASNNFVGMYKGTEQSGLVPDNPRLGTDANMAPQTGMTSTDETIGSSSYPEVPLDPNSYQNYKVDPAAAYQDLIGQLGWKSMFAPTQEEFTKQFTDKLTASGSSYDPNTGILSAQDPATMKAIMSTSLPIQKDGETVATLNPTQFATAIDTPERTAPVPLSRAEVLGDESAPEPAPGPEPTPEPSSGVLAQPSFPHTPTPDWARSSEPAAPDTAQTPGENKTISNFPGNESGPAMDTSGPTSSIRYGTGPKSAKMQSETVKYGQGGQKLIQKDGKWYDESGNLYEGDVYDTPMQSQLGNAHGGVIRYPQGRVGRATGGRIPEMDKAFKAAKKALDGSTKPMLNAHDDDIVHALRIAQRYH
jgi:hypothetical protein